MSKGRLEAFTDGVLAILITIMVLELKVPHESSWQALLDKCPNFISYILSFIYLGIYWNNHHHLLQATQKVNGVTLWANLHLLFWLSLIPFATAWTGEHGMQTEPVAFYGIVLMFSGLAFIILTAALVRIHGQHSTLSKAIGHDWKGKASVILYATAIAVAFYFPVISYVIYAGVAALWLIPDRRIENRMHQ
jgi:uncharacterized membrane protein